MEAIKVPSPPIFTPKINAFEKEVKLAKSIAQGTLLMA